jgi:hypothetical protein
VIGLHEAVERQVRYGRQRGVPWGISESGYNTTDAQLNYQYRAFGVPGLGLKRGLAADLVVAPYATVMALMVDPKAAVLNLARLADEGLASTYGFYEAIDYTPSRLPRTRPAVVLTTGAADAARASGAIVARPNDAAPVPSSARRRRFTGSARIVRRPVLNQRGPRGHVFASHGAKSEAMPAAVEDVQLAAHPCLAQRVVHEQRVIQRNARVVCGVNEHRRRSLAGDIDVRRIPREIGGTQSRRQ